MSSFGSSGQPNGYEAWQDKPNEQPKLSILALASLIFSILCLTAPLGLILGIAALFTIASSAGRKTGRGLAIAGVVIGLLFTSVWVFVIIGANSVAQIHNQQFAAPVGTFLQQLEGNDLVKAKVIFSPQAQASVTDAELTTFRDAYIAATGKFKKTPQSMSEMISGLMGALQGIGNAQKTIGPATPMIPVSIEFANGWGTVVVIMDPQATPGSIGVGSTQNLAVVSAGGNIVWLKNPSALPGGTIPALPIAVPPPQTPNAGNGAEIPAGGK